MCHLILLTPVLGLGVFWLWPPPEAIPAYGLILALSVGMYRLVMRSMRRPVRTGTEGMRGAVGRVLQVGEHEASVALHSEIWSAESADVLRPGDRVEVVDVHDLRLEVRRRDAPISGRVRALDGPHESIDPVGASHPAQR